MTTAAKTHISVRDLNVYSGKQKILNHIDIDIPDKKITVILGPSGCGKTTLLKSLNRLIELNDGIRVSGEVLVDGENIWDPKTEVTHLRKKLGLLLQRPQVLPMSIYDNVAYGPRIHGTRDKRILDDVVTKYLKLANVWEEVKDRLHGPAGGLSIGQQQRLCLARTLAIEPEVILGDETTSALDPISAQQIEQRFLDLKNQYTIVLVTHNLRQAKRLADYVIFLYLGDLIEHAPAEEFFNSPKYFKTRAYIEGKFIENFVVAREIVLNPTADFAAAVSLVKSALEKIQVKEILLVVFGSQGLRVDLSREMDLEGEAVLEIKKRGKDEWEMYVQKQNVSYAI